MLNRLDLRGTGTADLARRLPRPSAQTEPPVDEMRALLDEVRRDGDAALLRFTERFDGATIDSVWVPGAELAAAPDAIPAGLRAALEAAALETVYIHVWCDPSNPDTWLHLIEIDGFLAPTDERLGAVARRLGESLRQIWPLGGYAVPFTPAELDLKA